MTGIVELVRDEFITQNQNPTLQREIYGILSQALNSSISHIIPEDYCGPDGDVPLITYQASTREQKHLSSKKVVLLHPRNS